MERSEIGGLSIAYERAGDGPALLMLHGGLSDHREWRGQIDGRSLAARLAIWEHLAGLPRVEPLRWAWPGPEPGTPVAPNTARTTHVVLLSQRNGGSAARVRWWVVYLRAPERPPGAATLRSPGLADFPGKIASSILPGEVPVSGTLVPTTGAEVTAEVTAVHGPIMGPVHPSASGTVALGCTRGAITG